MILSSTKDFLRFLHLRLLCLLAVAVLLHRYHQLRNMLGLPLERLHFLLLLPQQRVLPHL